MMTELKYQLRYALPLWFITVATNWLPENRVTLKVRGYLASFFMKRCGRGFQLGADVTLLGLKGLEIGDNVYIARGSWLNAAGGLTLEDEVVIAPYVVISTLQHVFKNGSVRFGGSIARPVRIGLGSWLAAHATVKCGVTVGKGNIVAANASVVKDTPDHVIVGGVPARVLGENQDGEAEFMTRADVMSQHASPVR